MSEELQTQAAPAAAAETSASLLDEIIESTKLKPQDDGYASTKAGLQAFLKQIVANSPNEKISANQVDAMIADLDKKLSDQVNTILHNEQFQKIESAWRGLKFLVDRTDFRQNIKIEFTLFHPYHSRCSRECSRFASVCFFVLCIFS